MTVQITCGKPDIPYPMTLRDQEMLDYCVSSGEVWAGWCNNDLEAVWGVIPPSFLSDHAYLWLLNLPVRHPILLARYSRRVIATLHERWPNLYGHCRLGSSSFRWLLWLGAEFGQPQAELVPFQLRSRSDG
jgi:hypothetical protein